MYYNKLKTLCKIFNVLIYTFAFILNAGNELGVKLRSTNQVHKIN